MPLFTEDLVIRNKYSRPQLPMTVKGFVLHWTANKGATDEDHAEFFDGADGGGGRSAGAHMFVDKDSATLLVPENEGTYHANEKTCKITKLKAKHTFKDGTVYHGGANLTTLGLEMCVEKDGTIHPNTIKRSVQIMAMWCKTHKLTEKDIYRHFDITGKNCPAPFVEKPELFEKFKKDVAAILNTPVPTPKPKKVVIKDPFMDAKMGLVDYMKSKGMDSSFHARSLLAAKYRIYHYAGTEEQNLLLLEYLRD